MCARKTDWLEQVDPVTPTSAAAHKIWNSLPLAVRMCKLTSSDTSHRHLKTQLAFQPMTHDSAFADRCVSS